MRSAVVRLVLLLAVAAAALAVWLFALASGNQPDTTLPRVRLYSAAQDTIVDVAVRTAAADVAFEKRDGAWYFTDDPLVPVNLDRWGGVVLLLSGPDVERQLPPPDALHEFGLDAPSVVSVGLADGRQVSVRLGAETPDGRNVYAQLDGGQGVALINEPWAGVLLRLATDPPLPYWYYRVDPARVRLFEIEGADGIVTFLLGLPGTDTMSPDRVVMGDVATDLVGSIRDAVLKTAGGPGMFEVAEWPADLPVEGTGLDSPQAFIRVTYELTVPLDDKSAASVAYAVGARTPDGARYYAAAQDTPLLLEFDAAWVEEALSLVRREFAGGG